MNTEQTQNPRTEVGTLKVRVTQEELERISDLRRDAYGVRRELKPLEHEARDLLIAGAEIEKGRFEAYLHETRPGVKPRLAVIEHGYLPLLTDEEPVGTEDEPEQQDETIKQRKEFLSGTGHQDASRDSDKEF